MARRPGHATPEDEAPLAAVVAALEGDRAVVIARQPILVRQRLPKGRYVVETVVFDFDADVIEPPTRIVAPNQQLAGDRLLVMNASLAARHFIAFSGEPPAPELQAIVHDMYLGCDACVSRRLSYRLFGACDEGDALANDDGDASRVQFCGCVENRCTMLLQ